MELDHINTLGLATTIIAAPVFTGIYTLGSMLRFYATTAMMNTFSANPAETIKESAKFIPSAANAIALRSPINLVTDTLRETVKLVPSAANAVALRASNAIVAVKQIIEPTSQPICEAVKAQPLMIAPPPAPVVIPTIIPTSVPTASIDLINTTNINTAVHNVVPSSINTPTSYGNMFRFLVDSGRIASKVNNGEYLQASAYGFGMAIDYAVNETLSSTAGVYAESITGSSSAGLLVKGIISMTTSIALRKVVPFFAEGAYSYFVPTAIAEQKNPLFVNEPAVIAKKEENKTVIQKTAIIENNNVNANVNTNSATTKSAAEHESRSTTPEKKKPTQKVHRENSNERQFRRKLAALGVVEQDNTENNNVVSEAVSAPSEKKPVKQPRRMTSKERQFERKLAALMISPEEEQKQEQIQDENKYIEPNHDAFLSSKKEQAPLTDVTNIAVSNVHTVSMPTPAQRRDARLAKKAAAEKANLVQVVAIDGSPRELGKKSFKDNGCHPDLNISITTIGDLKSETKTLKAENNDAAPLLNGAKALCDALVNLFTLPPIKPVVTPARNLDWARESAEYWTQATQRSETRMKKAEAHLQGLLKDKQYTTPDMIERAQSTFNDCKEMYEKDKDYLSNIPKSKVAANF